MKTFKITTFGCQMNKHDSSVINSEMIAAGYVPCQDQNVPDVIIFNTCTVRKSAEDKFLGRLGELKPLKKLHPDMVIAVGGCLAQDQQEYLVKRARHIDIVFGTTNFHEVPKMIKQLATQSERLLMVQKVSYKFSNEVNRAYHTSATSGQLLEFVTIMVGCDNYCSYCIVPFVRGREVSRQPKDITDQIRALSLQGVREVTLLGQNVNSYGNDLEGTVRFSDLLRSVADIPEIKRVRFTTSHPKDLTPDIIEAIKDVDKICNYLHLPFQSGSDRILKLMNRKYDLATYLTLVKSVYDAVPEINLSADVIIGFPGETDEDFAATMDLIRTARFDHLFMFLYSPRKGTKAAELDDDVPKHIKLERFKKVNELQTAISMENNQKYRGQVVEVLCEGRSKTAENVLTGRTDSNKVVHFTGPGINRGDLVDVSIDTALSHYLKGKAINVKG